MGVPTGDDTIIENFMLQQIRDGEIRAYLTDVLIDFDTMREYGEGEYFWGIRGNGCGSDMIACNHLTELMKRWEKPIPRGQARFTFAYPLSWAHAHVNGRGGVSFTTAYKFTVKEQKDNRSIGRVEAITKDDIRLWVFELEYKCVTGVL